MENLNIYLELSNEKHHKFYELTLSYSFVSITYGRIGRMGRSKLKHFPTLVDAIQFFHKQAQIKIRKGYQPKTKGSTPPSTKLLPYEQLVIPFLALL